MAKETKKTVERVYNVPLRKEFRKVSRWKKTKRAVKALQQFLAKHMKSTDVKLERELNEELWKHGIKNPPHHVKVTVTKDDKGAVKAQLFGFKKKEVVKKKSSKNKTVEKPIEKKEEAKPEKPKKEEMKEAPKVDETPTKEVKAEN